jgi:hypothetical protein
MLKRQQQGKYAAKVQVSRAGKSGMCMQGSAVADSVVSTNQGACMTCHISIPLRRGAFLFDGWQLAHM